MKKVLIVDDTKFMRNILRNIIKKRDMEIVGEAANGEEAVELYKKLKPELQWFEGLYDTYRGGCLVFDVKIAQIALIRKNAKRFIDKCYEWIKEAQQKLRDLSMLIDSIKKHEVFTVEYPQSTLLSVSLKNWVQMNLERKIGGEHHE